MKKRVIEFNNVGKVFFLEREQSLKRRIFGGFKSQPRESFQAVKNISFKIYQGEAVGLWGSNGSGKSTILKLICGLYKPDEGRIKVKKKVASVLELGVGLHPDLTGRENIYFYGSIMHMKKEVIDRSLNQLIDFFGFPRFIDVPVRRYSSGMKSRLAFSLAVYSDAEILLLDEVLAVGDVDFKDKALKMIMSLKGRKTIVFTSHSYTIMQQLCDRMLTIRNGQIVSQANSTIDRFLRSLDEGEWVRAEALSNSMEPAIRKGDSMVIKKVPWKTLKVGDVVAFLFENLDEMLVHRIVAGRTTESGERLYFTRGDFSYETDPWELTKKEYLGKVVKTEPKAK